VSVLCLLYVCRCVSLCVVFVGCVFVGCVFVCLCVCCCVCIEKYVYLYPYIHMYRYTDKQWDISSGTFLSQMMKKNGR